MFTKLQILATVLGVRAEQHEGRPHWVCRNGPIVRILGRIINEKPEPGESVRAMTMEQAIWKAMEGNNLSTYCEWTVLPTTSPRASVYMELEAEVQRQEQADGEVMSEAIAGSDPREAIGILMEHIKIGLAMQIANPHEIVRGFFRLAVLAIAAYQWSQKWFATLQNAPLDGPIGKMYAFPVPPKDIPEPVPLPKGPPLSVADYIDPKDEPEQRAEDPSGAQRAIDAQEENQ